MASNCRIGKVILKPHKAHPKASLGLFRRIPAYSLHTSVSVWEGDEWVTAFFQRVGLITYHREPRDDTQ